jgi:hypothetical protein
LSAKHFALVLRIGQTRDAPFDAPESPSPVLKPEGGQLRTASAGSALLALIRPFRSAAGAMEIVPEDVQTK